MNDDDDPAQFAVAGMSWWNAMTPAERDEALRRAEEVLGRPASPADAYLITTEEEP